MGSWGDIQITGESEDIAVSSIRKGAIIITVGKGSEYMEPQTGQHLA